MADHFLEDLLGNGESLKVSRVDNEEDAIDFRVEERPRLTVSALHKF